MEELTERQKFILTLVIHDYIRTAAPIGSQYLVEQYRLNMSSATVRNELAALMDLGYIRQRSKSLGSERNPSAGRVPTEKGYRYFVSRLQQKTELPDATRQTIAHQFSQMHNDIEQWMRLAASVLAKQSQAASLVTSPHAEKVRVKHMELISTRGRQVLMVLVLFGGEIRQRILTLNDVLPQEHLSSAANKLTHILEGRNLDSVKAISHQLQGLEQEVVVQLVEEMDLASIDIAGEVVLDGISNVLGEPEFVGSEETRQGLRVLEERPLLQDLLSRTVLTDTVGDVQVLIGGEGTWNELSQCSLILAKYGAPGLATGTLGVLGPMRMAYGKSISTVRFLSNLLSDMVAEMIID